MAVARRRGLRRAIVALARRLAVIMHRLWSDGTEFRWTKERPWRPPDAQWKSLSHEEKGDKFRRRWRDVPRGTMDEVSSLGVLCRSRLARSERATDWTAPFF